MSQPNTDDNRTAQQIADAIKGLIDRKGSESAALEEIYRDNKKYRDTIRELKAQIGELEKNKVAEDALVLTGDEKKAYESYKDLGENVAERLKKGSEALDKLAGFERKDRMASAARAAGANLEVLTTLAHDIDFEVTGEGEAQKVVVITGSGDEATKTPFTDYADANWAPLKASLFNEQVQGTSTFPKQKPASNKVQGGTSTEDIIARKRASGEALII